MFTTENFYSYLHQYYSMKGELFQLLAFQPDGTRELENIKRWGSPSKDVPVRYPGSIALFDSEPVDLSYWQHWIEYDPKHLPGKYFEGYRAAPKFSKSLSPNDFVFRHFSGLYNPIITHSERNSTDVDVFAQNYFHSVYYFYHGLIAREWFRHWKHYSMPKDSNAKRLGLYARDGSGSRAYRVDLINKLTPYNNAIYFQMQPEIEALLDADTKAKWPVNSEQHNSKSSAIIDVEDSAKFQIQIVPETLFDSQKTHLTEKVFKPIVMRQPFIIVGPPHSLEYLRDYGFRTFDGLWDENYDKEKDATVRLDKILEVIDYLTNLNPAAFDRVMDRAQRIIDHNRRHFYSDAFEDQILLEIQANFDDAFRARNEQFYTMPGGTWFYYLQKLSEQGFKMPKHIQTINADLLNYLDGHDESALAKEIAKKYQNLI